MEDTSPQVSAVQMPEPPSALGFTPRVQMAFFLGVALMLLAGLFRSILLTSDDPSEGLADTGVWFGWIGTSLLSLSLVAAGYAGHQASSGVRVAFIAVGLYLFLQGSNSIASLLSAFF